MQVGLFINTQFPEGYDVAARVPEMVEQVRVARDAGFKSLWFPHHWLTYPMQMLQITPMMAYGFPLIVIFSPSAARSPRKRLCQYP